jgi:protein-ribulosamine 3-kinase
MLHSTLASEIEKIISDKYSTKFKIKKCNVMHGGCINESYSIKDENHEFFLKVNIAEKFPGMFEAEQKGLLMLRNTQTVPVPEVIAHGICGEHCFMIQQMIQHAKTSSATYKFLGEKLAQLHQNTSSRFGINHTNYIGSILQTNEQTTSAVDFYINERLIPQIALGRKYNRLPVSALVELDKLVNKVVAILPAEKPSLLHGDLWNGNVIADINGKSWIVDPAVYYGLRETDIAMTLLFGGFDNSFYEAYESHYPLEKRWKGRVAFFQVYPLLVHVNLFGSSYVPQLRAAVNQYI